MKLILALMIVAGVVACGKSEPKSQPGTTKSNVSAPKPNWSYGENVDKMSGDVTKWAMSESINKVDMKFPYNGGSEGTIVVFNNGVKIHLSKGQVMCSNYNGCSIQVKFDNEKPELYAAVGPSNGQSNHVYLGRNDITGNGAEKFVNKLKTANRVMIAIEMYQENSPVWEFNVSGFQPK